MILMAFFNYMIQQHFCQGAEPKIKIYFDAVYCLLTIKPRFDKISIFIFQNSILSINNLLIYKTYKNGGVIKWTPIVSCHF